MHYHLEIIIPPVDDVKAVVDQILKPFDENGSDEDGDPNRHAFWDWYVIGGRWAGAKLEALYDPDRLKNFNKELTERKVTVNSFQAGKQTLQPPDQIPMVDALWNEFFPDSPIKVCPFFSHFNDQYKSSDGFPDIMRLADTPKSLKAERVIVAGPHWQNEGQFEASFMIQDSSWNGVTHVDSNWNGLVLSAIEKHQGRLKNYNPDYAAKITPNDNWLVVTIDYHS